MSDKLEVFSIPPDEVILPGKGKRKAEDSWAGRINHILSMTAEEAAGYFGVLAENKAYPQGVTIKDLMIARAIQDFMEKPSSSIWNSIMERSEGKVAEAVNVHQVTEVEINIRRVDNENAKED